VDTDHPARHVAGRRERRPHGDQDDIVEREDVVDGEEAHGTIPGLGSPQHLTAK
jgi:hypothetical protein